MPLNGKLDVHQFIARFVGQRLRELTNFFSDFQFQSPVAPGQGQKTEWSRLPHSCVAQYIR